MATITDVLETLLELKGLAQYLAGIAAVTQAIKAAAAEQDKLFRNERLFNRLGLAGQFEASTKAVDQLSRSTGYARNEIEQVVGQLLQAGISAAALPKALQAISDAAAGNAEGLGFAETGDAVVKGILGKERALEKYGTTIHDTGSRMGNLNRIEVEFAKRFQGDAALRTTTLPGALDRLGSSFNHFLGALGNLPAVVHVINRLASGFDYLADRVEGFFNVLQYFSPLLFFLNQAAARDHEGGPAAALGRSGGLATEKTQQQIADNTKLTADAIEKGILGGPGFRARQAFTFRDMKMTLSI